MGSTLDALSLQRRFLSDLGSNFDDFGMIFARFGKLFGINKNDSGTNRSKNKLWGKSFHRQSKTYSGTNRSKKQIWDKSFHKTKNDPTNPPHHALSKKRGRAFSPLGGLIRRHSVKECPGV